MRRDLKIKQCLMTTTLTTTGNANDFMAQLNAITGMSQQQPKPKNIKFNATNGVWSRETDEKADDDSGYNKWVDIGDSLLMHIVTSRKKYKAVDANDKVYSKEFSGGLVTLYGPGGGIVFQGSPKEVKESPYRALIKYVQVLYAFVEVDGAQVLHRVNLAGSNLVSFFPYLQSFGANESVAAVGTMSKLGRRMKGEGKGKSVEASETDITKYNADLDARRKPTANLYYELEFSRVGNVPQELIVERVTDVMAYLKLVDSTKVVIGGGIEGTVVDDDSVDFDGGAFDAK
jgi:hypothetical protein